MICSNEKSHISESGLRPYKVKIGSLVDYKYCAAFTVYAHDEKEAEKSANNFFDDIFNQKFECKKDRERNFIEGFRNGYVFSPAVEVING